MDDIDSPSLPSLSDDAVLAALAVIRSAAPQESAAHPTLEQLVSLCPRIVTRRWLETPRAQHPDVTILRTVAEDMAERRRPWPWGLGPLERIFDGLDKSFGLKAAMELAQNAGVTAALGPAYLTAATGRIFQILEQGELKIAARMHEVLLAAVEPDGIDDAATARRRVWGDWLDVAGKVLAEFHDERIYGLVVRADAALSVLARNDLYMQADVGYRFAGQLLAPLVTLGEGKASFDRFVARRIGRGSAYPDPNPERAVSSPIPVAGEALAVAEERLRAVLALNLDPSTLNLARAKVLLAQTIVLSLRWWGRDQKPSPTDELRIADARLLVREAVQGLGDNDLPLKLEALTLGVALGESPEADALPTIPRADDLVARYGLHEAMRFMLMIAQVLEPNDSQRLFVALAEFNAVARMLDEGRRCSFLRTYAHVIIRHDASRAMIGWSEGQPAPSAKEYVERISERATAEGWSPLERLRALFLAGNEVVPTDVMAVLEYARAQMPDFAALHADALDFYCASVAVALPQRVFTMRAGASASPDGALKAEAKGNAPLAIALMSEGLRRFVALDMPDAALEVLERYWYIVSLGQPGAAVAIIGNLSPHLRALEALAGEQVYRDVARLMRVCCGQLLTEAGDPAPGFDVEALLLEALTLAKGHALATLIAGGIDPNFSEHPALRQLLTEIKSLQMEVGSRAEVSELDEFRLVSPYRSAQEERGASSAAQRLQGLRHAFDAALFGHLLRRAPTGSEVRIPLSGLLPDDTAMLVFYVADMNGPALVSFFITNEPMVVGYQHIDMNALVAAIKNEAGMPAVGTLATVTLRLRERLMDEPWDEVVAGGAGKVLEHWAEHFVGPVAAQLADLQTKGKKRLLLVPHGPLHVFPIHLLGPPGHPLCQDWLIRVLPVMRAAGHGRAADGKRRRPGVVAFGIDFRGYPGAAWPELDNAPREADRVAACVPDSIARNNSKATKQAVAHALQTSRWLHLSTHGRADAYAPCFNAIMLWPEAGDDGALSTHELLRLNLRGLELVTLAACDLALGRFDEADNLRSIPAVLLALGVGAVIGALWPADNAVSETFFVALYQSLAKDMPIEQAFDTAQRTARRRYPAYRDWGVFVLFG